ncbi:MAG: AtpZ/AtpI family protein [Myxococcales bacterium]|nr:AtpZ/AtpI family protein [Myxococcota bacterium]MDW8281213.1 AtpZ/AtpI family protein [Myxococcales bacterium]
MEALSLGYVGIFFGVAVAIGYLGGAWADRHLHTRPWLAIIGILLGIAAGFRELHRIVVAQRWRMKKQSNSPSERNLGDGLP